MAKKKIRSWQNSGTTKGETNNETSKTMPDMHVDPRVVLENHVRGINPITGAILDKQHYYGDNILPYAKDLTFEELRMKRQALETQIKGIINPQSTTNAKTENTEGDTSGDANVAETPSTQENL